LRQPALQAGRDPHGGPDAGLHDRHGISRRFRPLHEGLTAVLRRVAPVRRPLKAKGSSCPSSSLPIGGKCTRTRRSSFAPPGGEAPNSSVKNTGALAPGFTESFGPTEFCALSELRNG